MEKLAILSELTRLIKGPAVFVPFPDKENIACEQALNREPVHRLKKTGQGHFPFSPKFRKFWFEIKWNRPFLFFQTGIFRGTQRQFSENICSEDDLRSRTFRTFVVKFIACRPLLGFKDLKKWCNAHF